MSNRIYQIIALAILIGAPVVVNLVSNALPGAQRPAAVAAQNSADEQPLASSEADLPEPAPEPTPLANVPANGEIASGAVAAITVTPVLDPQGIAPQAASGDIAAPAPPAPPAAAQPAVQPTAVASYKPPLKTQGPHSATPPWQKQ